MTRFKNLLRRNRIGELLVETGLLSPQQLKDALSLQKKDGRQLGRILVQDGFIRRSALRKALVQQWGLRAIAAVATVLLAVSSMNIKTARADQLYQAPALVSLTSQANAAFKPMQAYPSLYGTVEKKSLDIDPFTKWTGMFQRFERALEGPQARGLVANWKEQIRHFRHMSLEDMAMQVNHYINQSEYILDKNNWGQSDYWATPVEFFRRGGDCEDFAIAKYASLKALGVPEDRLRVAIVKDLEKNIPHAVLVVYTDGGAVVLDNQNDRILRVGNTINRYKPIFSINRTAWWLHSESSGTVVASMDR